MTKTNRRLFILLSVAMGLIVILSNYLVQFPIYYKNLQNVLTYGAFSYPVTFLITDLANRAFGKYIARKIVYLGFFVGIILTFLVSTNFTDLISIRIAIGSATAFLVAQNFDVTVFHYLRKQKRWYIAPLISSITGSIVDTFLFFSISFYNTGISWLTLAIGDLIVKLLIALLMLIPFRILLNKIRSIPNSKIVKI